jgi:hypothetical protein
VSDGQCAALSIDVDVLVLKLETQLWRLSHHENPHFVSDVECVRRKIGGLPGNR